MAVGRPILLLGPTDCHVADLIQEADLGWHVPHGDVDQAECVLREIRHTDPEELATKGARARELVAKRLSKATLCGAFCDVLAQSAIRP